jgi:prepilin signal peptidase PulO-like enzyme (type II secretory pathway)
MQLDLDMRPVAVASVAAGLGWFAGAWIESLANLMKYDEGSSHDAVFLVRVPVVKGCMAMMWGLLVLRGGLHWTTVAAGILAIPLIHVAITDLRFRSVYTMVAGCGLIVSLVLSPSVHADGPLSGAAGAALGFVATALLRELGRLGYRGRTMGRGDVAIGTMVGAAAGPEATMALAIGVMLSGAAALALLVRGGSRASSVPYGTGLCLGGLICLVVR